MQDTGSSNAVTIVDNGLRCFVPPCFQWDILRESGEKIATASKVEISSEAKISYDWQFIVSENLQVIGKIQEYRADNGASGIAFIIERLVGG